MKRLLARSRRLSYLRFDGMVRGRPSIAVIEGGLPVELVRQARTVGKPFHAMQLAGGCGKPVRIRREPVAVTGDDLRIDATGLESWEGPQDRLIQEPEDRPPWRLYDPSVLGG